MLNPEDTLKFCAQCGELRIELVNDKCEVCTPVGLKLDEEKQPLVAQLTNDSSLEDIANFLNQVKKK